MMASASTTDGPNADMHIADRTFEFASRIVNLCKVLDEHPGVRRTLARQIIRAGTSIGVHVEESQTAHSTADFIHTLETALKSARETRYWLRLLIATELIPKNRLTTLVTESEGLMEIIASILTKARHSQFEDFGDFLEESSSSEEDSPSEENSPSVLNQH